MVCSRTLADASSAEQTHSDDAEATRRHFTDTNAPNGAEHATHTDGHGDNGVQADDEAAAAAREDAIRAAAAMLHASLVLNSRTPCMPHHHHHHDHHDHHHHHYQDGGAASNSSSSAMHSSSSPSSSSSSSSSNILLARSLDVRLVEHGSAASEALLALLRAQFEAFGPVDEFSVMRGLRRIRIALRTPEAARECYDRLNGRPALPEVHLPACAPLVLYFASRQFVPPPSSATLTVPVNTKAFLVSPPSSPPIGWHPVTEPVPVASEDIATALAQLGVEREILPAERGLPAIMVADFSDPESFYQSGPPVSVAHAQTAMPPRL
ncbi:hypothetical protein CAOG_03870 [Capsaspora owczarzaki ATCC 30864]|uniref:Uncharacterized protein n=1 Tax=Capsaspora owczarzaki (strain ATCC 30864) TaxID=595528 RepID=A0A0D2UD63_CAPO3|nr:hypothetical protein CAOG_03870 [Capsaspora owczarzaki ATCC 30864]KJE93006.1 hypothetical protein CAOG_003870 [Capsaspora owczarzaki ATCC 30864]|eukprot:XP_004363598.1 hypothetical protein CAOG_03870 [Capsaspora owczarzaki ATCC 30864]